ncbi:unnamed protein product [Adineta steineri]|uniref:Uncharacterized protein n=1 Tax=Adineta steineri TaxID=433720 RepID=A0A815MV51_9BILA|nr:unnamed protein product [Adineta steineri]CAF1623321.1 unnamed protein product [Adineta steineri]
MSATNTKPDDELLNFNWRSVEGYSRLKTAKLLVRKAEAEDIKAIQREMAQEGESYEFLPDKVHQKPWSQSCSDEKRRYQTLWDAKLEFIQQKQLEQKEQRKKKRNILDTKQDFQTIVAQRNRVLDKTSVKNDEDDEDLFYLIHNLKLYEKAYHENLKQLIEKFKTIYPIYDISLACKEITLSCLSSLSDEEARNYCEQAATASLAIQEKLKSLDYQETLEGTSLANNGESSLRFSLDSCCRRYQFIRLILQTVLTLKTLTTEDRATFQKYLELVNRAIDKYEACYVYILVRAYLNGNDVNYDDKQVKDFIEKCEQMLIREDTAHIRRFLVAVTALHFNRGLQYPILKFSIDEYKRLSASDDKIVEKAISILNQQEIKVCPSTEPSALESIGLIPKCGRPGKESMKSWCDDRRNYLCISGGSKLDFPVYIHKSEIIELLKLIRDQFKFDFDGQYEEEEALNLPHEPLSSLVIYWSKEKQYAKNIQGQLRSGREIIQLDDRDYYVRLPGVKESYQDLERVIFKRLMDESEQYTAWFRQIIKESGKDIDSDREFVLFAHAKVVSECARNLSTWMVNLMCLDFIENDITLDGKSYTDNRIRHSPWNLFFERHSMTGGSYHNQMGEGTENRNQDEIERKELLIVMNWLCIFWTGNENVAMVNDSDIKLADFEQVNRTKLEAAERYARTCILNTLYYRMYSIASWDCNHFEEVLLLQCSPPFVRISRRILGQMFFDDQPLRLIEDDHSSNFNDSPDEAQLKNRRLESSKETDRDEVKRQSIKRFKRLVETTPDGCTLRDFYLGKLQQLKSRNPLATQ